MGRLGRLQSTAARHKGRSGTSFFVPTLSFLSSLLPLILSILFSLIPPFCPPPSFLPVFNSLFFRRHLLHPRQRGRRVCRLQAPAPSLDGLGGSKQPASNGEAVLESYRCVGAVFTAPAAGFHPPASFLAVTLGTNLGNPWTTLSARTSPHCAIKHSSGRQADRQADCRPERNRNTGLGIKVLPGRANYNGHEHQRALVCLFTSWRVHSLAVNEY